MLIGFICLLIAVAIYIAIIVMQRNTAKKVEDFKLKKEQLESIKVRDEILEARKLTLTGKSLQEYQKLERDYNSLSQVKFNEIDKQINLVLFHAKGISFWKTRAELTRLEEMVDKAEEIINSVRAGLRDLKKQYEEHQAAISDLKNKYDSLRKQILAESHKFGPAVEGLNEFLNDLEQDFSRFKELTNQGNHAEASDIYEQLAMETTKMESLMKEIPNLLSILKEKFVDQLKELKQGHEQLVSEGYVFANDSILEEVKSIEEQRQQVLHLLRDLKVKEVEEQNGYIAKRIDSLYELMEAEIIAKTKSIKQSKQIDTLIKRLTDQNRVLDIETLRLAQNFELNNNEIENRKSLFNTIVESNKELKNIDDDLKNRKISYSEVIANQNRVLKVLTEVETQQKAIWDSISKLETAEKEALQIGASLQQELTQIRTDIEMIGMPGLPQPYLEFFFTVSNEIKRLAQTLQAPRINMDEVQRQLNIVSTDMDTLNESSKKLKDAYAISQQLLQYANRYSTESERVRAAAEQAKMIFDREYDYVKAMELIGDALDSVEPGVYQRFTKQQVKQMDFKL